MAEPLADPAPPQAQEPEQVDAFGRALRKEDVERAKSRDRSRDRRSESRDRRRSRDRSRDRDDSRERDRYRPRYGDRSRDNRRFRGGGGGGYGRQPPRGRFRGYHDDFRGPPEMPPLSDFVSLPPMPSFQHFMRTQLDDVSPEEYQQRYKQFQMDYLLDFEACFFENYHHLEWFQEHYDPYKQSKVQERAAEWAKEESERFKEDLTQDPATFVARCRLGPPEPRPDADPEKDEYLYNDGMFWRGLKDRTLVMKGIAGKIAKSVLDTALRQAFGDIEIESMAFSDPGKNAQKGFERTVWVTLPKKEDVEVALQALKDLNLMVPEEFDRETGSVRHSIEFPVHTQQHIPRPPKKASPDMSNASRVTKDTDQALTLTELLDAERRVPDEFRMGTILEDADVTTFFTEPTDKLDVIIAYLRRVHCFAYYGGYDCRDIGDMLFSQPHVVHRVHPYREDEPAAVAVTEAETATDAPVACKRSREESVAEESGEVDSTLEAAKADAPVASAEGTNGNGAPHEEKKPEASAARKDREEGEEEEEEHDGEEGAVDDDADEEGNRQRQGQEEEEGAHIDFFAKHMDRRIDARMALARSRIEMFQKGAEPEPLQQERKEVDECVSAWLAKHTEELPKGLVQCRYEHDKPKKFKAENFLHKHLLTKHVEMLDLELVPILTPYMRANYDKEQTWEKPLPPVSVESQGGITNIPFNKLSSQLTRGGRARLERSDRRAPPRPRGRGRRASGPRGSELFHGIPSAQPAYQPPRQEDNDSRRLQSYVDIDAPQEVAAGLDYGSVLAPPKKRRLLKPTKG